MLPVIRSFLVTGDNFRRYKHHSYQRPRKMSQIPTVYIGEDIKLYLLEVAQRGNISATSKILKKNVDPNFHDEFGHTPLYLASAEGHYGVVELLLSFGANVNISTADGVSPLHMAVRGNHLSVIKQLIVAGACLNQYTCSGLRPLDYAKFQSAAWLVLKNAERGQLPELMLNDYFPLVPRQAVPKPSPPENPNKKKKDKKKIFKKKKK